MDNEKRIKELKELIHVQGIIMEGMCLKRGEYFHELSKLTGKKEPLAIVHCTGPD